MASTYTTGFGIEKIGSGEQSGAWGTTTNHNLDILDRIASYKAVALSGTTHTLTVREASPGSGTENLQDGMYRVIKFTGALGANNTVTIAPNTAPAYFIFENATTDSGSSGPYSVILTQGSGANITIQNGKNAIVYCDGAGSGAAVVNALSDLQIATLEVTGVAAIDGALTAAAITGTTLTTSGIVSVDDTTTSTSGTTGSIHTDGGLGVAGTAFVAGTAKIVGVTTHGDDVVSDTDSTDDLGTTGVRWANLFVDAITATDQVTATGFTGTLDGILGSGTPAAATVTTIDASGVATATTFEPDGDTSAGDNAAMGYTSVLGAILTGQGSTNDVTLVNDADATVIGIPTGTTNVAITGDLTANNFAGRNKIIGGDFTTNPWQRGTSFAAIAHNAYCADRWVPEYVTSGVITASKAADAPTAAQAGTFTQYCLSLAVTTADTSIAASDVFAIAQKIEGLNAASLGFGQAGTRYVTLSFWVKGTKTGIHCVGLKNGAANRTYVAEYTIDSTNTWEYKTITIPADTTGTWLYTNGIGIALSFALMAGSGWAISADTWTASNDYATSNQVNALDSTSNTFKIALVQLEAGSAATTFDARSVGTELALCQRYYTKQSIMNYGYPSPSTGGFAARQVYLFPVTMRTAPTVTSTYSYQNNIASVTQDAANVTGYSVQYVSTALANITWGHSHVASAEL